jgi:hypothetical protein
MSCTICFGRGPDAKPSDSRRRLLRADCRRRRRFWRAARAIHLDWRLIRRQWRPGWDNTNTKCSYSSIAAPAPPGFEADLDGMDGVRSSDFVAPPNIVNLTNVGRQSAGLQWLGAARLRAGYAFGGRAEYAFASNTSLKAECLHYDLGKADYAVAAANNIAQGEGLFVNASQRLDGSLAPIGLNVPTRYSTSGAGAARAGAPEASSGGTSALRGLARDVFDVGAIDADVV